MEQKILYVRRSTPSNGCENIVETIKELFIGDQRPICSLSFGGQSVGGTVQLQPIGVNPVEVEYSSNMQNWQTSPIFTNQTCGNNRYWIRVINNPSCVVSGRIMVSVDCACSAPQYGDATPTIATCSGEIINNNARIRVEDIVNGDRYGYSVGSVYTGPAYAGANPIAGGIINIQNLPGSESNTIYTIRIFNGQDGCRSDLQIILPGRSCSSTPTCINPTVPNAATSPATCTGSVPNNDASITVSGLVNATKYGYSTGSDYNGPGYSNATPIVGGNITIVGLTGSVNQTVYVIRIWGTTGDCYVDRVVPIPGANCGTPPVCITPNFTLLGTNPGCSGPNPTATGVIYMQNVTNGNRYGYSDGSVYTGPAYTGANPITDPTGPFTVASGLSIPTGSPNRTWTVRVFNGANDCYFDKQVTLQNVCVPCTTPEHGTFTPTAATCTGNAPNNNASFTMPVTPSTVDRWGWSYGSVYVGPAYSGATPRTNPYVNAGGLNGSASPTNITVRLYNGSDSCYVDVAGIVPGVDCTPTCTNPTFSTDTLTPAVCSGGVLNGGSIQVTGIANSNGWVLFTGPALSGYYPTRNALSGSTINTAISYSATEDRTYTLRLYNGSDECYTDIPILAQAIPCVQACGMTLGTITTVDE